MYTCKCLIYFNQTKNWDTILKHLPNSLYVCCKMFKHSVKRYSKILVYNIYINGNTRKLSQTTILRKQRKAFPVLDGSIDATSKQSETNLRYNKVLEQKFEEFLKIAQAGGGEKGRKRHESHGKCSAAERLQMLLDDDSEFMELSPLAGMNMEYGTIPRAGAISGYLLISKLLFAIKV